MHNNPNKNMYYTEPLPRQRTRRYDEHYCHVLKDGQYVGSLFLNRRMRGIWRKNKFAVVIMDI